jgi:hypothetical protein
VPGAGVSRAGVEGAGLEGRTLPVRGESAIAERNPWEHELWRVSFSAPLEDIPALRQTIPMTVPVERQIVDTDPIAEEGAVYITVGADDEREAIGEAKRLYGKARETAGLGPHDPEVTGILPPLLGDTLWHILFVEAGTLVAQGRHELAAVRAQTGLEVYAKVAFEQIVASRVGESNGKLLARHCRVTLDRATVDLLAGFTGQRASEEPWFTEYKHHLQRRNNAVHRGYRLSELDAKRSLAAVDGCFRWLQEIWAMT